MEKEIILENLDESVVNEATFYSQQNIPSQISQALYLYGSTTDYQVLGFIDASGDGSKGMIFTDQGIYFCFKEPHSFLYEDIEEVVLIKKEEGFDFYAKIKTKANTFVFKNKYLNLKGFIECLSEILEMPVHYEMSAYEKVGYFVPIVLNDLKEDVYEDLERSLDSAKEEREAFIQEIVDEVKGHIDHAGIKAEIDGRVKHMFSIYKKMVNQHKTIDQIYDLFAVRIKVDTVKDCYAALGIIHEMYKPIPGRFKDYIAMPKPNMYQSLHTTLIGPEGHPFEIQIRTFEMHRVAEYGIAAHWKYKENNNTKGLNKEEEKLSWLREVLEWQRDMDDNKEFLSLLKTNLDLFAEQVYCFTPNGDVKNLANGSTPIDFAYSIHSAVGNKMVGARVNGRQVPFDYHLQNGDRVEIITSQNSKGPSRDWLGIVKSAQARSKINQWFKRQFKEENIVRGKELLEKYCKSKSIRLSELMKPEYIKKVELKYGFKDWDSVCAAVGHGGLKEGQVINKMQEEDRKIQKQKITDEQILQKTTEAAQAAAANPEKKKDEKSKGGIVVRGANDVAVRFSKCCNPVPGDEIVGFITRGRGISIHRTDCVNLLNMPESDRARLIEAEWQVSEAETTQTYTTEINIYANNRKGLLAEVSKIFLELDIDIITINVSNNKKGRATLSMSFDITGVEQLNRIIAKIRNVEGVIDIERTAG